MFHLMEFGNMCFSVKDLNLLLLILVLLMPRRAYKGLLN